MAIFFQIINVQASFKEIKQNVLIKYFDFISRKPPQTFPHYLELKESEVQFTKLIFSLEPFELISAFNNDGDAFFLLLSWRIYENDCLLVLPIRQALNSLISDFGQDLIKYVFANLCDYILKTLANYDDSKKQDFLTAINFLFRNKLYRLIEYIFALKSIESNQTCFKIIQELENGLEFFQSLVDHNPEEIAKREFASCPQDPKKMGSMTLPFKLERIFYYFSQCRVEAYGLKWLARQSESLIRCYIAFSGYTTSFDFIGDLYTLTLLLESRFVTLFPYFIYKIERHDFEVSISSNVNEWGSKVPPEILAQVSSLAELEKLLITILTKILLA